MAARLAAATAASVLLAGCGSVAGLRDAPLPAEGAADAYWALRLRDHAINLSVADTLRLEVTAVAADGRPVPGVTAAPTYTVQDSEAIAVSATGVLAAHKAVDSVGVVAQWQYGGVTHADTAYVRVTETAPPAPLTTLSIQPSPGDSAKSSLTFFLFAKKVTPVTTDAEGSPMSGLLMHRTTSDVRIAIWERDWVVAHTPGTVTFTVVTYAYGVRKADSLVLTIGLPTWYQVMLNREWLTSRPLNVTLGVGALVTFWNCVDRAEKILFDTPDAVSAPLNGAYPGFMGVDGGNIDVIDAAPSGCYTGGSAWRQFNTVGRYPFHDGEGNLIGTIIIKAD